MKAGDREYNKVLVEALMRGVPSTQQHGDGIPPPGGLQGQSSIQLPPNLPPNKPNLVRHSSSIGGVQQAYNDKMPVSPGPHGPPQIYNRQQYDFLEPGQPYIYNGQVYIKDAT